MNKLNRILLSLCLFTCALNLFAQNEEEQKKLNFGLKMGLGASGSIQEYHTWYPLAAEKIGQQLSGSYVWGAFLRQKTKANFTFQLEANYQNIGNTFYHYSPALKHRIIEYRFAYLQIPVSCLMPLQPHKAHGTYFRVGFAFNFLIGADKELNDYHEVITHSITPIENLEEHNIFIGQTVLGLGYKTSAKMSIELVLQTGLNYQINDDDFCFYCLANEDFNDSVIVQTNRNLQLVCYYSFRN